MKSIVIEGWRYISHSYAMVNQNQLLELKKYDLDLYHVDLPFYRNDWGAKLNPSGFEDTDAEILSLIDMPHSELISTDVTYRISFPFRFYPARSKKLFVFGTSEYQNIEGFIHENQLDLGLDNSELKIITPSNWSKQGFVNSGFDDERVLVVPHGVSSRFQPITKERRESFRKALGCSMDDLLIFSSGGSMAENKGMDVLIIAYCLLKQKYPHIRLILKDSSDLYGIKAKDFFFELQKHFPNLLTHKIYSSIVFISGSVTQSQLNGLYGSCDCYVAPYRAEGFNLGPLEAAASGSIVFVTDGGSTDDYFDSSFGVKIEGKSCANKKGGAYIEPNLESLLKELTHFVEGKSSLFDEVRAQAYIRKNFTWEAAVKKLVDVFNG